MAYLRVIRPLVGIALVSIGSENFVVPALREEHLTDMDNIPFLRCQSPVFVDLIVSVNEQVNMGAATMVYETSV
jgi:hypothetical protein